MRVRNIIQKQRGNIVSEENMPIVWPDHPQVFNTLLLAATAATLMLGLATLMHQPWLTWLGLVIAAGILVWHVWRYRQVMRERRRTHQVLDAQLIGRCRGTGGPRSMQLYYDEHERMLLLLTDDALHICSSQPLQVVSTIPLYNIADAQVGQPQTPLWEVDRIEATWKDDVDALNLAVRMGGETLHRLAFHDFERHAPPEQWADALRRAMPAR